ncbi:hypothetical protein ACFY36_49710 [Actinoplanes sp. NPDC000266]
MTDFATSVDRLLNQVRHWEAPRWRAEGRGDRVYALVQRLADLAADAESRPRREVPRESDLVLPDQLRVMADDIPPGALDEALAAVDAVRKSL